MKKPLHAVVAENFFSLRSVNVELQSLNVLVGPNGAGKSNFLRIFEFLGRVADDDLEEAVEAYGGFENIRYKGSKSPSVSLGIKGEITEYSHGGALDEYKLSIFPVRRRYGSVGAEMFARAEEFRFKRFEGPGRRITLQGAELKVFDRSTKRKLNETDVKPNTSGLSLLRKLGRDKESHQIEEFAQLFLSLRLVDIDVARARRPSQARNDKYLQPDGGNIAAVLLRLQKDSPSIFSAIEEDMRHVLPSFENFSLDRIGGGDDYVTLSVKETHFSDAVPLDRASFGTIRAAVLFAMLNDPSPPRITCIEEIDHGFHPQALDRIVFRLRKATKRTQIILATHSPALVNRMKADELIMFNRDDEGATVVSNPDAGFVAQAKERHGYELGELWFAGLLDV